MTMALELRPEWCLSTSIVNSVLTLDPWVDHYGKEIDSDSAHGWIPGNLVRLKREIRRNVSPQQLAREFGVSDWRVVAVAARWSCGATSHAGVHVGGPAPLGLRPRTTLTLDIAVPLAHKIEIETLLLFVGSTAATNGLIPPGSVLWSDSWDGAKADRTMLLEGDRARVAVRSVSFRERFSGERSSALWAIDCDSVVALDDSFVNVITVLINTDITRTTRRFLGEDGEPDLKRLPNWVISNIQISIIRTLTGLLIHELAEVNWISAGDLQDFEEDSVARILGLELIGVFGSIAGAVNAFRDDGPYFERRFQSRFAPNDWGR